MAGTQAYGTLPVGIWRMPEFVDLTWQAQWAYMLLATQRSTSMIGTLALTVRRWARCAPGASAADVTRWLSELEQAGFVATDEATGEAWVWQARRPQGLKHYKAALVLAARLESPRLRSIVAAWLGEFDPSGMARSRLTRMRLTVYRRDGFACRYCGWSPTVPEGYDGSYALGVITGEGSDRRVVVLELDHIYPEVLGGAFALDNLQTLCNTCNARKGARV